MQNYTPTKPSPLSRLAFASTDPDFDLSPITNANVSPSMPIDPLLVDWDKMPVAWPQSDDLSAMFGPLSPSPSKSRNIQGQCSMSGANYSPTADKKAGGRDSSLIPAPLNLSGSRRSFLDDGLSTGDVFGPTNSLSPAPLFTLSSISQAEGASMLSEATHDPCKKCMEYRGTQMTTTRPIQRSKSAAQGSGTAQMAPPPRSPNRPFTPQSFVARKPLPHSAPAKPTTRSDTNSGLLSQSFVLPGHSPTSTNLSGFGGPLSGRSLPAHTSHSKQSPQVLAATVNQLDTSRPTVPFSSYPPIPVPSFEASSSGPSYASPSNSASPQTKPMLLDCNYCLLPFKPSAATLRPDVKGRAYCSECIKTVGDRIVEEQKIQMGIGRVGHRAMARERTRVGDWDDNEDGMDDEMDEDGDNDVFKAEEGDSAIPKSSTGTGSPRQLGRFQVDATERLFHGLASEVPPPTMEDMIMQGMQPMGQELSLDLVGIGRGIDTFGNGDNRVGTSPYLSSSTTNPTVPRVDNSGSNVLQSKPAAASTNTTDVPFGSMIDDDDLFGDFLTGDILPFPAFPSPTAPSNGASQPTDIPGARQQEQWANMNAMEIRDVRQQLGHMSRSPHHGSPGRGQGHRRTGSGSGGGSWSGSSGR